VDGLYGRYRERVRAADNYLIVPEADYHKKKSLSRSVIQPEWASYMLESMPDQPYRGNLDALLAVEGDMKRR
jgi:hypothetical protein